MPGGSLVTVPVPAPSFVTPSDRKLAVKVGTSRMPRRSTVNVQAPAPLQPPSPPLQPVKTAPGAVVTLRVTVVPLTNAAAHVGPQAMPAGRLVTVMPGRTRAESPPPTRTRARGCGTG